MTPEELSRLRTERGHTQRGLADVLGVASNTVARWERGERPIPRWVEQSLTLWQQLADCERKLWRAQHECERLQRRLKRLAKPKRHGAMAPPRRL